MGRQWCVEWSSWYWVGTPVEEKRKEKHSSIVLLFLQPCVVDSSTSRSVRLVLLLLLRSGRHSLLATGSALARSGRLLDRSLLGRGCLLLGRSASGLCWGSQMLKKMGVSFCEAMATADASMARALAAEL